MTKKNLQKLRKLADAVKRHEEAIEQNFTPRTVAVIKMRVGAEGGEPLMAKDVAKALKVSESWVNKAQKQITDFCAELDRGAKATRRTRLPKTEPVVPQPSKQLLFKGEINLKEGKVTVIADAGAEQTEAFRDGLVMILKDAVAQTRYLGINEKINLVGNKAGNATFAAWIAAFVSAASLIGAIKLAGDVEYTGVVASLLILSVVSAGFGLIKWFRAVSLNGERRGLLTAARM